MSVPAPYVAALSSDLQPLETELCVEVPRNGVPRIAYVEPRPGERDAHGNLWCRKTRVPGGHVLFGEMDPERQRECMEGLLCQICAQPAERKDRTLFIEWQHDDEPPMRLNRIKTDMPPLCPSCVPVALRHCPFLRRDQSAVLLRVRKSIPCGVGGTTYQASADMNHWIPVFPDAYSSYNKPRHPGLLAGRMLGKLRGVTVVAPECLA
ncbi:MULTISPECIES: hypothetical protein [unclassified Streptomyces]|uniref:hypothetical protein n=1 Tax=unclassified Streptomyces TaxID=2593676 RepID=UPI00081F00EF|nr:MULTISPECIES: hypothetical protein [unclassified Streptomyces]MYR97061.1 hypothetical protein [Streptomyces sp. SID4937]SCE20219.1 hypothetical protein GA0115243_10846 [Streptomyces sp. ScaeMP-e83]